MWWGNRKYINETKEISKLLIRESIKKTCNTIQDFLFSHIQYSYNDLSNIKSPACVWASKKADCKSYSVFASSILLNLGIKHYFRIVNLAELGEHIYVVVPINQEADVLNDDSKLNEAYFVIDGTTNNFNELNYAFKRFDAYMDPNDLESEVIVCGDKNNYLYVAIALTLLTTVMLFSIKKTD